MTWRHVSILAMCLVSVVACGFHPGCVAVLPQVVTLVTFVAGGTVGDARSAGEPSAKVIPIRSHPPKEAKEVTKHE